MDLFVLIIELHAVRKEVCLIPLVIRRLSGHLNEFFALLVPEDKDRSAIVACGDLEDSEFLALFGIGLLWTNEELLTALEGDVCSVQTLDEQVVSGVEYAIAVLLGCRNDVHDVDDVLFFEADFL